MLAVHRRRAARGARGAPSARRSHRAGAAEGIQYPISHHIISRRSRRANIKCYCTPQRRVAVSSPSAALLSLAFITAFVALGAFHSEDGAAGRAWLRGCCGGFVALLCLLVERL